MPFPTPVPTEVPDQSPPPTPPDDGGKNPDKLALMVEAHKRGILPAEKKPLYDEALKRGLLPGVSASDTGSSPAPYKEIVGTLAQGARSTVGEIKQGYYDLEGRDRSVDYGPGAGFVTERALKEADNPKEAKAVLEKIYGKGNAGQDRGGNWWVKKGGKRISVFGDDSGLGKRAATSAASELPEMAGMTGGEALGGEIGAALGAETGPGALATGAIGAGIGAGMGKGYQELWKWSQGALHKTPKEETGALESSAASGVGGALAGRTLTRLGGYLLRPKELPWVNVTPQMEKQTADALAHGMVPRIDQATGAKAYRLFIMDQRFSHYIWGDPAVEKNVAALNKQLEENLVKAGVPKDKIPETMNQIVKQDVSTADVNHDIVKAVNHYREGIEKEAADGASKATKELDSQLSQIDKSLKDPKLNLSEHVENDIIKARKDFSETSGGLYQTVDELTGGRKLVESGDIKQAVNDIIEGLPKTEAKGAGETMMRDPKTGFLRKQETPAEGGKILGTQVDNPVMAYIRDMLKLPDKITLSDAQRIRSSLLELTRNPGLTPGVGWKELHQISNAVDASIDGVGHNAEDKPVLDALRTANSYYKDGIQKFKDVTAESLVKEAGQRGAVEPEKVMDAIIRPGKVAQTQRIMRFLQPDTRHQLARDYFQSLVQQASDPMQPGKIMGRRLLAIVNKDGDMIKAVLGKDALDRMVVLAKNTAALDKSIPVSELAEGDGAAAVKNALEAQKAVDSFMDEHYLRSLAKPGADADRAFDYVTKPGRIDRLKAAMSLFGRNSEVAGKVRQKLMAKILSSSIGLSSDPAEQLFAGNALKESLTQYGRPYLEEAFGKEMADDLFKLGDTVALISSKPKIGGAVGMVAGVSTMLHPLHHIGRLVDTALLGKLMSSPAFIKWLIFGIKGDSMAIKTVNQLVRQSMNLAAQGAIPNSSEESPEDQRQDALSQ